MSLLLFCFFVVKVLVQRKMQSWVASYAQNVRFFEELVFC
jgi:hypothetical protein